MNNMENPRLKDWKIGNMVKGRYPALSSDIGPIVRIGYDCDGEIELICFRTKRFWGSKDIWERPIHLVLVNSEEDNFNN